MERQAIDSIARTVLYEGYVLYPYRPSSLKNSKPCAFGVLYPEAWAEAQSGSDRSQFTTEVLLRGRDSTRVSVLVRFLQFSGEIQPAVEREVSLEAAVGKLTAGTQWKTFSFGGAAGVEGEIALRAALVAPGVYRLSLTARNTASLSAAEREQALPRSLASAHAAIFTVDGSFVSMTDPPRDLSSAAAQCVNEGVWPVLLGVPGATDTVFASPIILPDYPQLAPESPGDLFDATEIDEILTLRILTLTDAEKAEVRSSNDKARAILERAESLSSEHLMNLHGTIRGMSPAAPEAWSPWDNAAVTPVTGVRIGGARLSIGDRVRLRPGKRADILDSALAGRIAIVAGIEEDFESNIHVAVVIEDDPGRDLGEMRYIGHRFFFALSEIEPLGALS